MMRILIFISLVFSHIHISAAAKNHAVAKVRKGENIEELLKRFLLTPHNCNIETFCTLNHLKNKKYILEGKVYKLPLLIIDFNGTNIRSTLGIHDVEMAKKIEKLNIDLLKTGIRDKNYKSSGKIWVPMVEFECDKDEPTLKKLKASDDDEKKDLNHSSELKKEKSNTYIPVGTELKRKGIKEINVPLMGPGYDVVHVEDFSLEGQVFYIISGHGGPDPGALCTDCQSMMCEDEYAYDVSLRLARNLMQHGATVHMIVQDDNDGIRDEQFLKCDNDELLLGKSTIPLSQKQRLRDRAVTINKLYHKHKKEGIKIQKSIEIHVDSRNSETRQDVFFYFNKNNKHSKILAENVQDVFASKYETHQKDRGYQGFVEDRCIYMVRNILPANIYVELANIRNASDQKRLLINTNRQALANWLFEGLRK